MTKTNQGRFFEDFSIGQTIQHATPRTLTDGDVALYTALYGSRFVVNSSDEFANMIGYQQAPVDDLLVFHIVFGKTVPDISMNAIANLGYAEVKFFSPVYPGYTLSVSSEIIGLKLNSNGKNGVVYVRTKGVNQFGKPVLEFVRWVMVHKKDENRVSFDPHIPNLQKSVQPKSLAQNLPNLDSHKWDEALSGSSYRWDAYEVGEKIDHVSGMTIEEAEHQLATRLYQNTAKVHFNQHIQGQTERGRRLIYGGHVISLARSLSFNGLGNAFHVAAINGGRHVAPCFADDTVYAWSEILAKELLPGREDVGALRVRTVATKDMPCQDFPLKADEMSYVEGVLLDLDYWVVMPR